jgi:hypothetical protein
MEYHTEGPVNSDEKKILANAAIRDKLRRFTRPNPGRRIRPSYTLIPR